MAEIKKSQAGKPKKEDIIGFLEETKPEVDKTIEKYLPKKVSRKWLEMVFGKPRYEYSIESAQKSLLDPLWDLLERGGKRWRPALFLLVAEAVGGDTKRLKDFAIIPEIVHNGTLMIDDIEDMGELRRGLPCTHKKFGEDIAINAGNFMYYFPLIVLMRRKSEFKKDRVVKAYEVYVQEMINISLGQGTDIYWHRGQAESIKEAEYLQMCAYKTGCLSRMSAKLAAALSGCNSEKIEKLGAFAEAIGVAFQVQDDVLDIALDEKERLEFGKPFGNDIKEGKRTLMVIHALEKADKKDRARLLEILNKHTDDLKERKEAIGIIKKYGGLEHAKGVAKLIVTNAWKDADKILEESPAKEKLRSFANYLIERKV
ncbi:MAG: polyprenyl synthetase family protein [Candidatus Aenigmarchaeota archaeon]|nr:polyprenyl synthetase family protein [Candidatus Aenigmarchaeota archaeon]